MAAGPIRQSLGSSVLHRGAKAARSMLWTNPLWVNRWLGNVRSNRVWQRALVRFGHARGWVHPRNFVLLCAARSGTTMLVDYLNCHPQVRCRGEILGEGHQGYGSPFSMDRTRLALHVQSLFVKRPGILVGAKILTYHLDELPVKSGDLAQLLDRPKVVVLYRAQILEQFVSLKLAERDGLWHSRRPAKNQPIRLDPATFLAYAARERRMWRESLAGFGDCQLHYVTYDDLTTQAEQTMQGVFQFLGLEACPVQARFGRLRPHPLAEKLLNYQDYLQPDILPHTVLERPVADAAEPA